MAAPESSLEVEMAGSVRAGDIISLSGRVVSKREVDGLGLVECAVVAAPESSLEVEMAGSVRAGDIISLTGRVVSKREVDGLGLVECALVVAAQEGDVG